MKLIDLSQKNTEDPNVLVVKVSTFCYHDRKGVHMRKDINILRRRSSGFDFLTEDCSMCGADLVVPRITNLQSVKDGLYQVKITNVKRDWESGNVDDYDYVLVPIATDKPSLP